MISMSEFVAVGGMETLLKHAISVYVGQMTADPKQAENFYVDIRFNFNKKTPRPYFGEKDLDITTEQTTALDAPPTPTNTVSILSDDSRSNSDEVEVVNEPSVGEHSGPVSETYTDYEFAALASDRHQSNTQQETAFLPDGMWIARTQAISSILKQHESVDKTDAEEASSNIVSVRGAVRAIESKQGSDFNKQDDVSKDIESGLIPLHAENPPSASPSEEETDRPEPRTEPSLKQHKTDAECAQTPRDFVNDPNVLLKPDAEFVDTSTLLMERPSKGDHVADPGNIRTDEAPPGCGLLRTSSLKAAVKTLRRSFSRDGKRAEASDTGAERASSNAEAGNYVDSTEDVDEIQPNCPPPAKQTRLDAENIDSVGTPPDMAEKSKPTGDRAVKQVGSLLRRTSNLARNIVRKLSSSGARAGQQGAGASEENVDGNEDPSRLNKRRSLFRKGSSGGEQTNGSEDPSGLNKRRSWFRKRSSGEEQIGSQEKAENAPESNQFRKRWSLIHGRRQKSHRS